MRYRAPVGGALHAVAMIHLDGHPIAFHLDAYQQPKNWAAGSREGIWWLPRDTASDFLILTNTGDQPLDTTLILREAAGTSWKQKITIGSRQTTRLSVRSLLQKAGLTGTHGGITIDVPKSAWSLDTAHVVYDELGGSSQVMKMFDHDPKALREERTQGGLKDWTIRAPMLALSHPDPALGFPEGTSLHPQFLLRNTTSKAFTASVHFAWRSGASSGKTTPISVALSAHETRLVDVAALQEQNVIPMEAEWASVFVTAPGVQPDELMAVAMSYDEAGRYGAQTPFNDQLAGHWEGDQWQVDSTHNSLITAGNGGTKPVTAKLTLFFNHGQGKYELERMVAPEEQPWVDVGQLIHDQTLDRNGKSLPPGATSGAYKLEEVGSVGVGNLFEGKLILDKTYGSTAYGCMVCCGHFPGTIDYNPLGVPFQGDNFQGVTGVDGCTGDQLDTTDNYTTWWTGSTTIATANLNDIHGVGLGSTPHYARGTIPSGTGQQCHLCCPSHTQTIQASTNVGKKVYLVGTNCNVNPSVVFSGSWGDPAHLDQCALVDPLLVPSGGSCIQEGTTKTGTTKYCYQTNHNGCVTTYCPVDTRIMDSACTRFLDQSGDTVSSTPAGCS